MRVTTAPRKDEWINSRTGQKVEAYQVIHGIERKDFEIVYLSYLFKLFDKLGGKKYKILKYIIENKSNDNTLIITMRELAEATNTSTRTVICALKVLKEAGLVKTRTGAIILNAQFMVHGSVSKERYIMQKFESFDEKQTKQEIQTEQTDEQLNLWDNPAQV